MITGGYAPNALPQRVTVTINCRIFPGVVIEDVRLALVMAAADPEVSTHATQDLNHRRRHRSGRFRRGGRSCGAGALPHLQVVPGVDTDASDSVITAASVIPSHGVSGMFNKGADVFIHGLNECVPVDALAPALADWHSLLTKVSR